MFRVGGRVACAPAALEGKRLGCARSRVDERATLLLGPALEELAAHEVEDASLADVARHRTIVGGLRAQVSQRKTLSARAVLKKQLSGSSICPETSEGST